MQWWSLIILTKDNEFRIDDSDDWQSIHENVLEDVVPRIRDYTDSTKETFQMGSETLLYETV